MSRRIPQSFIDELIARADLLDVIGARVTLKKAGSNYKGLCPFHDEKTPSFSVRPDQGFFHCFGCGAHGTAIGFLMDYENRSFPEAVRMLADILGLEVPGEAAEAPDPETGRLHEALAAADRLYRQALREHTDAIEYLKNRGIDGETAARFGIGYAPDAWDTALKALGKAGFGAEQLLAAGLVIENDKGRRYDRFRNRIMFPIRDPRGRVIGFGGRVLGDGEPKYLNSPETPVFHKGQALYGLYEARQKPGRPEQIVVVEGYVDVTTLAQHGVEPAVATLGTATTAEHVRQLTRLANRVVFCFDGDRAGRAAAWRALNVALPFGGGQVEIRFLLMPEGADPDSLVRAEGADAFRARLDEAATLSRFMIDELKRASDPSDADGRAKLVAAARPLLEKLPAGLYRELLVGELADLAGLAPERFERLLEPGPAAARSRPAAEAQRRSTRIRKAITLLLHYPAAAREIGPVEGLARVDQPGAALLRRLLETVRAEPQITTAGLIERYRDDPEGRHLDRLAAVELLDDEAAAAAVLRDSIQHIVAAEERRRAAEAIKRRSGPAPNP